MRKILITGGTIFVSKYVAEYYAKKGDQVYVLNRNHRKQPEGVTLIEGDRNELGDRLKAYDFDVILDITAYTAEDVRNLLNSVGRFKDYVLISSSAVYPETTSQPFSEESRVGNNKFWRDYGVDKMEAEKVLLDCVPNAYILRPPYLYGPMNNVYREAFVFDCAMHNRKFYLPKDGQMKLQFFHVKDLCRFIDALLENHPKNHIFNVGNEDVISIREWVELCYKVVGKKVDFIPVYDEMEQRNYFSFYNYEYVLDVQKQKEFLPKTKNLEEGLKESYIWYQEHSDEVERKPYFTYIDENLTT